MARISSLTTLACVSLSPHNTPSIPKHPSFLQSSPAPLCRQPYGSSSRCCTLCGRSDRSQKELNFICQAISRSAYDLPSTTVAVSSSVDKAFVRTSRTTQQKKMRLSAHACDATTSNEEGLDEQKWSSARVLGYAAEEFPWWDRKLLSGAVVVRENGLQGPYRMYYYGRGSDVWNMGVKPFNQFLPTGRVGLATSSDGLSFLRYKGDLEGGAIMDPSDNPTDFDCVHIAVSDVHYQEEDKLWLMHYFGGGLDEVVVAGFSELPIKGIRLRPGVATSSDGLHFQNRNGPILDVGDAGTWDQNGVSWPRVLLPSEASVPGVLQGKWVMTYHTRELGVGPGGAGYFSAGLAISEDGKTWQKQGKIISAGSPGSWDENGVSVRHVVRIGSQYVMFYEGSNYKGEFAIGLAVSDDGIAWRKDEDCGNEPGGPILRAREGKNVWDNVIVATPYVLPMQDGSFRMYYLAVGRRPGEETKQGIGLAVSKGSDFRTWTRVDG